MLHQFDYRKDMVALDYKGKKYTYNLMCMWDSCAEIMRLLEFEPTCQHNGALPHPGTMAYVSIDWSPYMSCVVILISDALEPHGIKRMYVERNYPYDGIYQLLKYLHEVATNSIQDYGYYEINEDWGLLKDNVIAGLEFYEKKFPKKLDPENLNVLVL